MSDLQHAAACMRFFDDELNSDRITDRLGVAPTNRWRKGELWSDHGVGKLRQSAGWILDCDWTTGDDLNDQVEKTFSRMTSDMLIWRDITDACSADMFCGLFPVEKRGLATLAPHTLEMISQRGLDLVLEIYNPSGS